MTKARSRSFARGLRVPAGSGVTLKSRFDRYLARAISRSVQPACQVLDNVMKLALERCVLPVNTGGFVFYAVAASVTRNRARGHARVAVQPWLGILPERRAGNHPDYSRRADVTRLHTLLT